MIKVLCGLSSDILVSNESIAILVLNESNDMLGLNKSNDILVVDALQMCLQYLCCYRWW